MYHCISQCISKSWYWYIKIVSVILILILSQNCIMILILDTFIVSWYVYLIYIIVLMIHVSLILPNTGYGNINYSLSQSHHWRSSAVPDSSCKITSDQCLSPWISGLLVGSHRGIISHRGGAGELTDICLQSAEVKYIRVIPCQIIRCHFFHSFWFAQFFHSLCTNNIGK